MSIGKTFQKLGGRKEGGLIAYIMGGDPTPKYTPMIVEALCEGGADIIEIGVPFSDPMADGPTIQAAGCRALSAGTSPQTIFDIVKEVKRRQEVPVALMTYYNIVYRAGIGKFLDDARAHGVDGLIVPDLPIEEAEEYHALAEKHGINTIFLASPLTSTSRLNHILSFTSGFLYLVSVLGVTGARGVLADDIAQTVGRVHHHIANAIPLAVGFGISKPEHIKSVIASGAEGVIVGSAFVRTVEENLTDTNLMISSVTELTKKLKAATLHGI